MAFSVGGVTFITNGKTPAVATHQDDNITVVAHCSGGMFPHLWMSVFDSTDFSRGANVKYDRGRRPSIAMRDDGFIVEAHQGQRSHGLYWKVGVVRSGDKSVEWRIDGKFHSSGEHPSISLTETGRVSLAYHNGGHVWVWQGQLDASKSTIEWDGHASFSTPGHSPRLATSVYGVVVLCYSRKDGHYFREGRLRAPDRCTARGTTTADNRVQQPASASSSSCKEEIEFSDAELRLAPGHGSTPYPHVDQNGDIAFLFRDMAKDVLALSQYVPSDRSRESLGHCTHVESSTIEFGLHLKATEPVFTFDGRRYIIHFEIASKGKIGRMVGEKTASHKHWMSHYDEIRNVSFKKLAIPGSHDSAAYHLHDVITQSELLMKVKNVVPRSKEQFLHNVIRMFAKTQLYDIYAQLCDGIRFLDLRMYWYSPKEGATDGLEEGPYAVHELLGPSYKTILRDVRRFLEECDGEVVIINVSHFENFNFDESRHERLVGLINEYLGPYLFTKQELKDKGSKRLWDLTLNEFTSEGKSRVILFYSDRNGTSEYLDAHQKEHPELWPDKLIYTQYADREQLQDMIARELVISQTFFDKNLGERQGMLFELQWILTPQPAQVVKTAGSYLVKSQTPELMGSGNPASLYEMNLSAAHALDDFFHTHVKKHPWNIVLVDFYSLCNVVRLCVDETLRRARNGDAKTQEEQEQHGGGGEGQGGGGPSTTEMKTLTVADTE